MIENHTISSSATIIEALERINALSGKVMTLFVTDHDGRALGSLTDGDIRRALLGGLTTQSPVSAAMRRDFQSLRTDIDIEQLRRCRDRGIKLVPVLDDDGRIVRIADLTDNRSLLPLQAVLMAGGKGERLRPLTLNTPKPLLKVAGKAIIDYNVEALARAGITGITVVTRYMADQIADHFSRPVGGVEVRCVEETAPLGTIGGASLAPIAPGDGGATIVMNSDLLTSISFEDMYLHHRRSGADITIAAIPYVVSVPYAILSIDGDHVGAIEEKPTYTHFANAGIYIIANHLLRSLTPDRRVDATDLIEQAIADGRRVVHFPLNGTWIDIGNPADFRQAEELMRHHNNFTK